MTGVMFHRETSYESTSDEWKEYVHETTYYFDKKSGKITCRTLIEFQNTRTSSNTVTHDEMIEIERSKLSVAARAKLSELER